MTTHLQAKFGALLDMLRVAFQSPVSIQDYQDIVSCLRCYEADGRALKSEEHTELDRLGWSTQYHPCDHMENLRFGLVFAPDDNSRVRELLRR